MLDKPIQLLLVVVHEYTAVQLLPLMKKKT
jgi:hypothetical protein